MKRRAFLSGLAGSAATARHLADTTPALAQTPGRVYRLGHLANTLTGETLTHEIALPELAKLGFVEGRNLVFTSLVGEPAALPGMMLELLSAKADAVIAIGPAALKVAGAATRTVPVVGFGVDPIELGLAETYARPGGNVTGVVILAKELEGKRLSILREAVPDRRRMAVLVSTTGNSVTVPALQAAAANLGVELLPFSVATPAEYPAAFAAMRAAGAEALVIGATPEFFRDGKQLATLALEAKLPTVCEWAEMARDGCLIGYGPSRPELRKRMSHQIAAIFRGEPVGTIPIELPVRFDFAVNQKIATALGLKVPEGVLLRASEVIE